MKEKKPRNRKADTEQPRPKMREILDIPANAMSGIPQIEMAGNQEVLVDGCQGVIGYDENIIKLAAGKLNIQFTGRNLQIKVLTHDSAVITGFITAVEFLV